MASPAFWEDNRRAQSLVQERSELTRIVGRWRELSTVAEELRLLWEMAVEEGDESVVPEIEDGLRRLRQSLEEFELKVILSGAHDRKNAIVSIHPGAGGTESQDWAQMLVRMYLRWAERARFQGGGGGLAPGGGTGLQVATNQG